MSPQDQDSIASALKRLGAGLHERMRRMEAHMARLEVRIDEAVKDIATMTDFGGRLTALETILGEQRIRGQVNRWLMGILAVSAMGLLSAVTAHLRWK